MYDILKLTTIDIKNPIKLLKSTRHPTIVILILFLYLFKINFLKKTLQGFVVSLYSIFLYIFFM
jgi:hypothetical protein